MARVVSVPDEQFWRRNSVKNYCSWSDKGDRRSSAVVPSMEEGAVMFGHHRSTSRMSDLSNFTRMESPRSVNQPLPKLDEARETSVKSPLPSYQAFVQDEGTLNEQVIFPHVWMDSRNESGDSISQIVHVVLSTRSLAFHESDPVGTSPVAANDSSVLSLDWRQVTISRNVLDAALALNWLGYHGNVSTRLSFNSRDETELFYHKAWMFQQFTSRKSQSLLGEDSDSESASSISSLESRCSQPMPELHESPASSAGGSSTKVTRHRRSSSAPMPEGFVEAIRRESTSSSSSRRSAGSPRHRHGTIDTIVRRLTSKFRTKKRKGSVVYSAETDEPWWQGHAV